MRAMLCILLTAVAAWAQAIPVANLETQKLDAAVVTYQGKPATRLADRDGSGGLALLKGSAFKNGAIALWVGPGTEAHFANLKVTPMP